MTYDIITGWVNFSTEVNSVLELQAIHQNFAKAHNMVPFSHLLENYVVPNSSLHIIATNISLATHVLKTEFNFEHGSATYIDMLETNTLLGEQTLVTLNKFKKQHHAIPTYLIYPDQPELDIFNLSYTIPLNKNLVKMWQLDNTFPQKVWISCPVLFFGETSEIERFEKNHLSNGILLINEQFSTQFKSMFQLNESTILYNVTDKYMLFENSYEEDKEYMFKHIAKKLRNEESYYFDFEDVRILIHNSQLYIPFMSYDMFMTMSDSLNGTYPEYIGSINQAKLFLDKHGIIPNFIEYSPNLYTEDKEIMQHNFQILQSIPKITIFHKERKVHNTELTPNKILIKKIICGIPIYHLSFIHEKDKEQTICHEMTLYFVNKQALLETTVKQLVVELLLYDYSECEIIQIKDPYPLKFLDNSLFN